jgi:transporter family protein
MSNRRVICSEGILASLIGNLTYFSSMKEGMISRAIPIASAFPLVTLIGGLFLFSERIRWERLVRAIMIIGGIIIIRR